MKITMKETKKILENWEKEKKTPKDVLYYNKMLKSFNFETINKLKKFIKILNEEYNLSILRVAYL